MRQLLILGLLVIVGLLAPIAGVAQIIVTIPGLPNGETTLAYQPVQMTATGGSGTYQWSLISGALPTGLTLSPAGVLSGTPTLNGSFPITVQAGDGTSTPGERLLSLQVKLHRAPLTGTKSGGVGGTNTGCCGILTINGNNNQNQTIVGAGGITVASANGVTTITGGGTGGGGGIQSINGNTNPNQTITGTGAATVTSSGGNTNINVTSTIGGGPSLSSLTLNPTSVLGGGTSTGTAQLTGAAPAGGAIVTLSSSNTAAAQVPASVTIPANGSVSTFTVTTSSVGSNTSLTISGNYNATQTASFTVTAPPPPPQPIYGGPGKPGANSSVTLSGNTVILSTGDVLAQLQTRQEQVGDSWQFTTNNQAIYLILFGGSHSFVDENGFTFVFNAPIPVNVGGVAMFMYQTTNALFGSSTVRVVN